MNNTDTAIELLEPRRLLATLVVNGSNDDDFCTFEVDANFIYATMNGVLIPQAVGAWDDVQINLQDGNDFVVIKNTGDEPVDIFPGDGDDFVSIDAVAADLDNLSARVYMHAGTDNIEDFFAIHDSSDTGADEYVIDESPPGGPMRLVKPDPANESEEVWWGESNIETRIYLNGSSNTVTIDSTVNLVGTDEALFINGNGGDDTVTFNGTIRGDNVLSFEGAAGADIMNVTGDFFPDSTPATDDPLIEMVGGGSSDTLAISDSAATGRYQFVAGNTLNLLKSSQSGHFLYSETENVNLTSSHATQVAEYELHAIQLTADVSISAGGGDDTVTVGDGTIGANELGGDISINGGGGADDLVIADASATASRTHTWQSGTYDHEEIAGLLTFISVTNATLNCGSGSDLITVGNDPGVFQLEINGSGGADSFNVTPDDVTDLWMDGGAPTAAPGDVLNIIPAGATGGLFTPSGASGGSYAYPARHLITVSTMESFPQPGAAPGVTDLAAADDSGISSTDNITNDTSLNYSGSGAGTNTSVRLFRDGTQVASATASGTGAYSFANVAFPTGDDTFAMTVRYVSTTASLLSLPSVALNVRVDTIVPPTPIVAPDLDSASDTGISNNDNVTRDNTPTFNGAVTPNDIVRLFASRVLVGSDTSTSAGTYSITSTLLSDGSRPMQTGFEDLAGNQSNLGTLLGVTIDTVAPANPTVAPDLTAASDLGVSNTDNITRDSTPTFTGTAPGNHVVRLLSSGVEVGFVQLPLAVTTYNVISSTLADGNRVMTTRFEDIAGNTSPGVSPSLAVQIDTVAPTLTAPAAFNFLISQNLTYQFSENVGQTLSVADLVLLNLTNSTSVPSASIALNYVANTGTFTFPGFANGTLPDADYRARMTGDNLTDVAGNQFVGVQFDFFFLNGDANRDRRVNLVDFNIVAANFGGTNRSFSQGDFNYDRLVSLADFNVLASRFGAALGPAATGPSFGNRGFGDESFEEELL